MDRFAGYAEIYDDVRPRPPDDLARILIAYCGVDRPDVVDLGSGTGLSTRWASGWAGSTIGVEPSADMQAVAERRAGGTTRFVGAFAHDTGLPARSADVVLAVQSMHWMEPVTTLAEVARLLRPGGVFATVDCDWPPTIGAAALEGAWDHCRRVARVLEARLADGLGGRELRRPVTPGDPEARGHTGRDAHQNRKLATGARSWSKDAHLTRLADSGHFAWTRELALDRIERGDAGRFVGLFRSQGDYQALRRAGLDDSILGVTRLEAAARATLAAPAPWWFTYRVRLGVTPAPPTGGR